MKKSNLNTTSRVYYQHKPSINSKATTGLTLVALVVTIVVLLILAGITITYVVGDNSVFKQAQEAKLKTDIAGWQERLEMAKSPVFIEGLGTFNPDKYFDYIQQQGIINNKDTDVIDNGDGTYEVTTKPGYVFEITLIPNKENPTDAEIEYIGQAGKIAPIIRRLDVSATSTSITGKAVIARLGTNGTVKYYYKSTSADDSTYTEITNVTAETGATVNVGIAAGESYTIKVVAKNDVGEVELTKEITATKIPVESITLNKTTETVAVGKTVTLVATIKPDDATNKNVTWESSNTSIATVSDTGIVTGKTAGTITITVKSTDGSNKSATCIVRVKSSLEEIVGQVQTSNKAVADSNGNKVVVPCGFKVVPNGTGDVTYHYSGDGDPNVQDGVVIQDNEGNQFVWIPIGNIKNKDGTTTTITLGRYTFSGSGTPTLQQNATNYSIIITIANHFQEKTNNDGNTAAKSLSTFVSKANSNGGYYFGRYEASQGSDGKVDSQVNKAPWASITQPNAAIKARGMYSSSYVDSDLVNSYSWDTAIVFIQNYSGNSNYANKLSVNSNKVNTGKAGDRVCNIYDIASNFREWSTEHSTSIGSIQSTQEKIYYTCVCRGGSFDYKSDSRYYAANHTGSSANTYSHASISFRPILYLK